LTEHGGGAGVKGQKVGGRKGSTCYFVVFVVFELIKIIELEKEVYCQLYNGGKGGFKEIRGEK